MFLLNAETEVVWKLGKTLSQVSKDDLVLRRVEPDGTTTRVDTPITPDRFIAPTETSTGEASILFTPNIEGLWHLSIEKVVQGTYILLSTVNMQVSSNKTVISTPEVG